MGGLASAAAKFSLLSTVGDGTGAMRGLWDGCHGRWDGLRYMILVADNRMPFLVTIEAILAAISGLT